MSAMDFENPPIKEGVNVSQEHPLKEFFQLTVGVIVVATLVIVVLHFTAGFFAKKIPFAFEQKMVTHVELLEVDSSPQQQYLQQLADELAVVMDLPEDMQITVHYSDEDIVNAFATLGGHVFFYKGLIEKLESEDALAMVMAHEIAHVQHRHPIVAMGKGLTLAALLSSVSGMSGSGAGETLIGQSLNVGLLKFSRDQESQSDQSAAFALQKRYGHISGAEELFEVFSELHNVRGIAVPELLSSHPHTEGRWLALRDLGLSQNWQVTGQRTPLNFPFADQ